MTAWDDKLLANPHEVADKRSRVQKMFAAIAPSYDLNNRLHSLWMDQRWRRKAVALGLAGWKDRVVDVACGTGDLTLLFARAISHPVHHPELDKGQVIGVDFAFEMLPFARRKSDHLVLPDTIAIVEAWTASQWITWINGDAQALPLADDIADVVSIAFGIRNVQNPLSVLKEFHRILRPGGRVIILEFSLPTNAFLRGLYNFYFRRILPITATLISGDKTGAYKYLPESVNTFIGRQQMMDMMRQAGFERIEQFPLTFGVCVCYRGVKTSPSAASTPAAASP